MTSHLINSHKIIFTNHGKQIFSAQIQNNQIINQNHSKSLSLQKNKSLPHTFRHKPQIKFIKHNQSLTSRAQTHVTPQTLRQLQFALERKSLISPKKQDFVNLRFLNKEILNNTDEEKANKQNKFLSGKANLISRKFLQSLEKINNYNKIQEQKSKLNLNRLEVNMDKRIDQGRNYINRIVHRHKNQQHRYKRMIEKLRKKQKSP